MTQFTQSLFADHAFLLEGWRRNVLLQRDEHGALLSVTPDTQPPSAVERAKGPVSPGVPNVHSHAFQRAMGGLTEYRTALGAGILDSFWSWRDLKYRFAARITPEGLSSIAHWLYIEMLTVGYTSV
jgi:formimidoylglutamate deiminase